MFLPVYLYSFFLTILWLALYLLKCLEFLSHNFVILRFVVFLQPIIDLIESWLHCFV